MPLTWRVLSDTCHVGSEGGRVVAILYTVEASAGDLPVLEFCRLLTGTPDQEVAVLFGVAEYTGVWWDSRWDRGRRASERRLRRALTPPAELDAGDQDRPGRVLDECADVRKVARQDDRVRPRAGHGHHDSVNGRDGSGASGRGPEAGRFAGLGLVDLADLAGTQQTVDVEVTTVVPGERFGQDDRRHLAWPQPSAAQFPEPGALVRQGGETPGIEHQSHADRCT